MCSRQHSGLVMDTTSFKTAVWVNKCTSCFHGYDELGLPTLPRPLPTFGHHSHQPLIPCFSPIFTLPHPFKLVDPFKLHQHLLTTHSKTFDSFNTHPPESKLNATLPHLGDKKKSPQGNSRSSNLLPTSFPGVSPS
ncbi:hypothetical protein EPI10_016560 [Gossypium australe]|uniref:Uncharacterized protein n=1 Tax=Gossypium australe TaxID=47621 RepID=A0A5B6VPD6_9ROSI|nr:hypothetical protein EPI10_016560 [Gossypium australe]